MAYKTTEEGRMVKLGAKAREAAGAAMRGTDNAQLAIVGYFYQGNLPNNTDYVPAAGTIICTVLIENAILAADDFFWYDQASAGDFYVLDAFQQGWGEGSRSLVGVVYCDGVNMRVRNQGGAAGVITMRGFSI